MSELNSSNTPIEGSNSVETPDVQTERTVERIQEDQDYIPVIIKRIDGSVRHPDDILEIAIEEGLEQIQRPLFSLILSSIAAGLILGFTAMAVGVIATYSAGLNDDFLIRLFTAFVYPLGFIICILSGTQLFTEHTATAVYPVLEGKSRITQLVKLWLFVILGNLTGAIISAVLLTLADDVIKAKEGYVLIAHHLVGYSDRSIIISAILAGWLMALGGWLILSTSHTISQLACVYIVTFLIGLGGLHHSIAGAVEMFVGFLNSDHFSIGESLKYILLAITGNLIGGSIFVAVLNYGHIRKSQEIEI